MTRSEMRAFEAAHGIQSAVSVLDPLMLVIGLLLIADGLRRIFFGPPVLYWTQAAGILIACIIEVAAGGYLLSTYAAGR